MDEYILVHFTADDLKLAEGILSDLLESGVVACGMIQPEVISHFRWKGNIEKTKECVIIMKTKKEFYQIIESYIVESHTYSIPEVIAIPIVKGYKKYLEWIDQETS
ncbi:MAG: divalent-cation tolerance protein CutA [Chlamydiae bacterium]|nr:divalent-cation tolerance protein CutA [Chlamydiota bacterium]